MVKKLKICLVFVALLIPVWGSFSYALADCGQDTGNTTNIYNYQSSNANCPPTLNQVTGIAVAIIEAVLALSVVIFFFMLIVNGFNYITSMGDRDKIAAAGKGIVFSSIGFALIFFSFIILNILAHVGGITNGFSVSPNGSIQFNVLSTFAPTTPTP